MVLNLMTEELRMWGSAGSGGCGKERHPSAPPSHTRSAAHSRAHTLPTPRGFCGATKRCGGQGVSFALSCGCLGPQSPDPFSAQCPILWLR